MCGIGEPVVKAGAKKKLTQRHERNRALAAQDASQRCAYCKAVIETRVERFGRQEGYCSTTCLDGAIEYESFLAGHRRLQALAREGAR